MIGALKGGKRAVLVIGEAVVVIMSRVARMKMIKRGVKECIDQQRREKRSSGGCKYHAAATSLS
jgi:hypothetical protein